VVLEYRAGSSALPGVAGRLVTILGKQTSLTVLGPDQTRVVYGDHLDQAIFKCAGDADCIAKIGQRAGAAEVVLVGVSELGDVILTMQRIEVAGHQVSGRIAESLPAGQAPTDDQLVSYLGRILPPSDFLRFGIIDIVANYRGATVTVGGEKRGVTPLAPLRLHAPATYDIRVELDGYVPFGAQVAVPPDGEVKVRAELSRRGGATAWYQRWYVLAAAGAILVGATGTTIYVVTQKSSDRVPVMGTIQ
jgi:hypothetical protein